MIKTSFSQFLSLSVSITLLVGAIYYYYPEPSLPQGVMVDRIVVDKSDHRMDVYSNQILLKSYSVSLGRGEWGWKDLEWDNVTPVGDFTIDSKFTTSSFHKALTISFGNQIEIHGARNRFGFIGKFHRWMDWTRGCIAVTNIEIDELYKSVPVGTRIMIQE